MLSLAPIKIQTPDDFTNAAIWLFQNGGWKQPLANLVREAHAAGVALTGQSGPFAILTDGDLAAEPILLFLSVANSPPSHWPQLTELLHWARCAVVSEASDPASSILKHSVGMASKVTRAVLVEGAGDWFSDWVVAFRAVDVPVEEFRT